MKKDYVKAVIEFQLLECEGVLFASDLYDPIGKDLYDSDNLLNGGGL